MIVLRDKSWKWRQIPKLMSLNFVSKLVKIRMAKVWTKYDNSNEFGQKCQNISNLNTTFLTEFVVELNTSFFSFACSLFEPTLKEFQSDLSIVPFIYPDSKCFIKSLLLLIIKQDIIEAWKRSDIDLLEKDDLLH